MYQELMKYLYSCNFVIAIKGNYKCEYCYKYNKCIVFTIVNYNFLISCQLF
jgi:hypothetical protein